MKQLDEMERMAISMANAYRNDTDEDHEDVHALAEFACAVMPVVRAALDVRDANPGSPKWAAKSWRLRESIDDLRRRLGGE